MPRPFELPSEYKSKIKRIINELRKGDDEEIDPEGVAESAFQQIGLDKETDSGMFAKFIEYAEGLLNRQNNRNSSRAQSAITLENESTKGSKSRLNIVLALTPQVIKLRLLLWGSHSPLYQITQEDDSLTKALVQLWRWFEDDSKVERQPLFQFLGVGAPPYKGVLQVLPHSTKEQHRRDWTPKPIPNTRNALNLWTAAYYLISKVGSVSHFPIGGQESASSILGEWGLDYRGAALFIAIGLQPSVTHRFLEIPVPDLPRLSINPPMTLNLGTDAVHKNIFKVKTLTVNIYDPDNVSPEEVAKLYREARAIYLGDVSWIKRTTEAIALIELDLILGEIEVRQKNGQQVDVANWRWRPDPAQLLTMWKARASEFGLEPDDLKTRQAVDQGRKRTPLDAYMPSIAAACSR